MVHLSELLGDNYILTLVQIIFFLSNQVKAAGITAI